MKNVFKLKEQAQEEAYAYFDQHIRSLPKNKNGKIDQTADGFSNNDVDAFRHAYVSGVVAQELGANQAAFWGCLNETSPGGGISSHNSAASKNMDFWNNAIGRKYGEKSKARKELAELLKEALQNGEMITSLDDPREYVGPIDFQFDQNKPVMVVCENETGRNVLFCDGVTGDIFDREYFVSLIENDSYPEYFIASMDDLKTPMSKPDGNLMNNLG